MFVSVHTKKKIWVDWNEDTVHYFAQAFGSKQPID